MNQAPHHFLPHFCSAKYLLTMIISGIMLAIILTLASVTVANNLIEKFSLKAFYIQWVVLLVAAICCLFRSWISQFNHYVMSAFFLFTVSIVIFMVSATTIYIGVIDIREEMTFILTNQIIGGIVSSLFLRYLFVEYQRREQAILKSEAKFQALQSRIRPHFLFNSMNTVASLTRKDPALAESLIEDLADLFRASLAKTQTFSTLGDELELAKGYLRIEQQRLGERLQVEWDLDDLPQTIATPHLILQPLLENAVYHGIETQISGGTILISGRVTKQMINLSVRNPQSNQKTHRKGNGMAINNIRQRLQNAYGHKGNLVESVVDGDYQVRLSFPLFRAE